MQPVTVTHGSSRGTLQSPMIRPPANIRLRDGWIRPVGTAARPVEKPEPDRAEILNVLDRAAGDPAFIAQLTYSPTTALEGYSLSQPAKAALASGDVRWIEACTGKLDSRLRTWLDCRLQQEIW